MASKSINDADIKLMLLMIASAEGIKTDNEKLAKLVGDGASANAIRQRVQKVKNIAKAVMNGDESGLVTPVSAGGTKRKATNKETIPAGEGEKDETPSKKKRCQKPKLSNKKVDEKMEERVEAKVEADSDDEN